MDLGSRSELLHCSSGFSSGERWTSTSVWNFCRPAGFSRFSFVISQYLDFLSQIKKSPLQHSFATTMFSHGSAVLKWSAGLVFDHTKPFGRRSKSSSGQTCLSTFSGMPQYFYFWIKDSTRFYLGVSEWWVLNLNAPHTFQIFFFFVKI